MDLAKRIVGYYLLLTALAAALLLIVTPLIHDGSPEYPLWKILNWFMAAGTVAILVGGLRGQAVAGLRQGRLAGTAAGQRRLLWGHRAGYAVLLGMVLDA